MPEPTPFDLAQPSGWFGVRPGMSRAEVIETMQRHPGVEIDTPEDENVTAATDHWEMELYFATDGKDRLRQVSLAGDVMTWNGRPIHRVRLGKALGFMEPLGPAMWTANDAIDDPFKEQNGGSAETVSDDKLLTRGTLWLAERRLGLVVNDGELIGVAWREPQDFPRVFAGPLTEAQRDLSRRKNLTEYLREQRMERVKVTARRDPMSFWRSLLATLALAAVAAIIGLGIRESISWNEASVVQAKVIGSEQVPYKGFRDFLPSGLRWVIPFSTPRLVEGVRLEYLDSAGQRHETVVELTEINIYRHDLGEEVPFAYLAGPPPQVRSYQTARDAGFLDYTPSAIAIGFTYMAGLIALSLLPLLWRLVRSPKRRV